MPSVPTGRNYLLQSIYYGSFRYWLYFLIMPKSVIAILEADAKQILWATEPELLSNETGTAKRSRRYIHHLASYLPLKEGGGNVMCWPKHCEAFYAQWMVRYLHPRRADWKIIANEWIPDELIGNAIIVANIAPDQYEHTIPPTAPYLRRCLAAFQRLHVRQNTSLLDHAVQAEPLWPNWRFSIDLPEQRIAVWQDEMKTVFVSDMLDTHDDPFDEDEWDSFFDQLAPAEPPDRMQDELRTIWDAIGDEPLVAAVPPPTHSLIDRVVAIVNRSTHAVRYAYAEAQQQGAITYHDLWLDMCE
jgi:hypothetical protein